MIEGSTNSILEYIIAGVEPPYDSNNRENLLRDSYNVMSHLQTLVGFMSKVHLNASSPENDILPSIDQLPGPLADVLCIVLPILLDMGSPKEQEVIRDSTTITVKDTMKMRSLLRVIEWFMKYR